MNDALKTLTSPELIRADLWETMTIPELEAQRVILTDRVDAMLNSTYMDPSPTMVYMRTYLSNALEHLNNIIAAKQQQILDNRDQQNLHS